MAKDRLQVLIDILDRLKDTASLCRLRLHPEDIKEIGIERLDRLGVSYKADASIERGYPMVEPRGRTHA